VTYKTPLIIATAVATVFGLQQFKPGRVLSETVEISPTAAPSPTITPSPSPTVTPKPTKIPTPTPKPQPAYTSQQIYEFTNEFGGRYGVDPNVIRHITLCESTFKPAAKNYIYAGLFQFDTRTWQTYRRLMGENPDPDLRYNAREAIKTGAFAISKSGTRLWPNCKP